MQQFNINTSTRSPLPSLNGTSQENQPAAIPGDIQEAARAAERARLRQGIMHVRIRHFYCTLEEMFDPSLRGQAFVVGTGTGRPNEPGRVIDVSPLAQRLGVSPGMPLRRARNIAPRTRFLPASYDRYQPILQKLRERYKAYSRIIESIPIADAFIDLRGCEIPFDTPVALAERLCAEVAEMGLTALIGVANGKAIAELAALIRAVQLAAGHLPHRPARSQGAGETAARRTRRLAETVARRRCAAGEDTGEEVTTARPFPRA